MLWIENSVFIGETAGAEYLKSKDPVFPECLLSNKNGKGKQDGKFTTQSDFFSLNPKCSPHLEAIRGLQGADFHPASLCTLRILIHSVLCVTDWFKPLGCVDEIYEGLESAWYRGKSWTARQALAQSHGSKMNPLDPYSSQQQCLVCSVLGIERGFWIRHLEAHHYLQFSTKGLLFVHSGRVSWLQPVLGTLCCSAPKVLSS